MLDVDVQYVNSVAYHEAGHIVVAAVLGLPLLKEGIYIDGNGDGLAHYRSKQPDGSTNVGYDPVRERTIIATYSGNISHRRFYPQAAYDANARCDTDLANKLLEEMHSGRNAQDELRTKLVKRSEDLVKQHWPAIETIAKALLDKKPLPESGSAARRRLEREEVVNLLRRFEIYAVLGED